MPEIEQIDIYLDATKDLHHGFGFDNFVAMIEQKVAKTNIARSFGVTPPTIYDWLEKLKVLKEQKQNENDHAEVSK